jgi:hypothetical protein
MITLNRLGLVLNALMLASLVAVVAGPLHRFLPAWQPIYLVGASFLVALEAGLVHHVFRRSHMWLDELARYLVPELFVMVILMRVATTLSLGFASLAEDARRWLFDPLSIFDAPFVGSILAGALVGLMAHAAMSDLFQLEPRESEAARNPDDPQIAAAVDRQDRSAALRRISSRFVIGGALLLLALGLEAVNIERVAGPSQPIATLSVGAALVYLVSGFLLYSQARLALLRARWRAEGARVADDVPRRWARISWLVIVGVTLAVALLPRAYGLGLLTTIVQTIGLLGYAIALLGYLLTSLLSLLVILPVLLISLLTGGSTENLQPPAPLIPPPAAPPPGATEPRLFTAILFWVCMLALAIYAVATVVQRNPALKRALESWAPLAWLLNLVGAFWRDTRSLAGAVVERARDALRRDTPPRAARLPGLRLRRLAPRELVRYFYRSTLRRAAASGLGRRSNQTPYEYGAALGEQLPEARQDIVELTESFVQAEYSPRPIEAEQAQQARRPWERMRQRLRAVARQDK